MTNSNSKFFEVADVLSGETEEGEGIEKLNNAGKKNQNLKKNKKKKGGDPLIEVDFEGDKAKVVLISSGEEIGEVGKPKTSDVDPLNELCSLKDYDKAINKEELTCGAHYAVGASEKLKGLKLENADSVETLRLKVATDYEGVKEQWGFPDVKDFRIVIYSPSEDLTFEEADNNFELVVGLQKPSLDTEVFVREFNTFTLSEDGIKVPITINIRVW